MDREHQNSDLTSRANVAAMEAGLYSGENQYAENAMSG
eukprot:SAG31_NODE_285_length_18479_cov_9.871980_5_plen_38_part_00